MMLKKEFLRKIILSILIIMMFTCVIPIQSHAAFTSVLTKPICWLIIKGIDSINGMAATFMALGSSAQDAYNALQSGLESEEDKTGITVVDNAGNIIDSVYDAYYNYLMSPDKIFANKVKFLDANIFAENVQPKTFNEIINSDISGLSAALKGVVSNIYVLLRNIAAVILLCLLIYTGIRILIMSASPYDQAKWKQALIDWVKALCLLMFMHFIMIGIFYISDLIVESLSQSFGNTSIVAAIRWNFNSASFLDGTACIINTIMYVYVTYLTLVFFIAYFKRFVWIVILTIFSPIIAVTYALGQKQHTIFNTWLKEYIYAVLLQPFHMLIFYVLVALPLGLLSGGGNMHSLIGTNYSSIMVQLYVLISISMIRPAEKFLMKLFGFDSSSVAKQGSSESGVKTIKAVEKVVKDTVGLVVGVVGAVATGGATAAMGNVAKGATAKGMASGDKAPNVGLPGGPNNMDGQGENGLLGGPDSMDGQGENGLPEGPSIDDELAENTERLNYLEFNAARKMYNGEMTDEDLAMFAKGKTELMQKRDDLLAKKDSMDGKDTDKLDEAADRLIEAADDLSEAIEQFDVSDTEFDDVIQKSLGDKLKDRLQASPVASYFVSGDAKEHLNEIRSGANQLRDSMYLDDAAAPGEWKNGYFGYDESKKRIDDSKTAKLDAFVNNENNINYMKNQYGLKEDDAKKRLQSGGAFVNMGISNVGDVDRLISARQPGEKPTDTIIRTAKIENTVNDQSRIQSVAQIIAKGTGESAKSPRVQQEAKATLQQAKPYVEAGKKDPEVLHRLVQLENRLKGGKVAQATRTPQKVMRMDKIIDKAMKDGLKKIKITNKESSEGMKQVESVMNKELKARLEKPKSEKK